MTGPSLIIGSGCCANEVARLLAAAGRDVLVAVADDAAGDRPHPATGGPGVGAIERLPGARLLACHGFVGRFEATFTHNGATRVQRAATIVVAEDTRRRPNFDLYRLRAAAAVRSLSDFKKDLAANPAGFADRRIVFLHGLRQESTPVMAEEVFRSALELQKVPGARGHVLTGNLKVAAAGLEVFYRDARQAGTLFFKFSDTQPAVTQSADDGVVIGFRDEVTGQDVRLAADVTVVDERIVPAPYLEHLAAVLGLQRSPAGFLQTENVHRLPVYTNRHGILAVGPARAVLSSADLKREAACGARAALGLAGPDARLPVDTAEIDPGQCIHCLTCYRLCPYGAVTKASRIAVVADACAGCGICVAECPRGAIRLGALPAAGKPASATAAPVRSGAEPGVVVFCCARSADRARTLAVGSVPEAADGLKVITVPCAGAVSVRDILGAFAAGAGGVLVLTCHIDNCHSETGNRHARRRVEYLVDHLEQMGFGGDRLQVATLAANMPTEYADVTRRFYQNVKTMRIRGDQ
ncbi:MAG: hydrogenase iron-sulfur subunit [Desulfobacterales bacterium]